MTSSFPWQALRVICNGISIIDTPKLELNDEAEAYQFIATYGFDLFHPPHAEYIWKIYEEACVFLRDKICSSPSDFPSHPFLDRTKIQDIRKLLLLASGRDVLDGFPSKKFQAWACAILRIMHTISHLQSDLRLKYLAKIRKQTIGRFEAHIQSLEENGASKIFLGFERDKIPLVWFEKKEFKFRDSILIKLLHKPQNTAQEVYDFVGVRFVTRTRSEAILVLKYLVDRHLVSVANIMPAKCRNNLVSLEDFQKCLSSASAVDNPQWPDLDAKLGYPEFVSDDNPFSSPNYRAIQFTTRPLVRIPVKRKGISGEMSFFFPMEIQVCDEASFNESQTGEARHSVYKQKQLEAVRERVLQNIQGLKRVS